MALLRTTSIQKKLTLLVMLTTSVALLVTAVQFITKDVRDSRRRTLADLNILARILGEDTMSSLEFGDKDYADRTLAGLKAVPHLVAAAVYKKDGGIFAKYIAKGASPNVLPQTPPPEGHVFQKGHVAVSQPIVHGEENLGSIYLTFELVEIWQRVGENCFVIAVMLVIAGLVAFFVTARLQRLICQPIMHLADVANAISEKQDYSVRATKQTEDEIGFLIGCFNGMLARIQKHEATLREVNEQLANSEKRAMTATEAKSQFLANMSHELRTPLNAIIGYAEMVSEELKEAGQTRFVSDLEKIYAAARHLLALINDILDLSKVEAGKMTLCVETFDISLAIQEIVTTVRPLLTKTGNHLELVCPEDLGTMRTDKTKLRQILFNLLSNAAKFTERGSIKLEVRRCDDCPLLSQGVGGKGQPAGRTTGFLPVPCPPSSVSSASLISFSVTDTGIGMSPAQLGGLFQAFNQADATTTRKYGGTGLGLAISKKFCHLLGGDLNAVSEPGKGSTFAFTLPAHLGEPTSTLAFETAPAKVGPGSPNGTILVIDDEVSARELFQRVLTKEGYLVELSASGPEGLARARQHKPGAIILDVVMAGMDGWDVLSALKAEPLTSDIPVIMVTVMDEKNLGFALGAADYLLKPIDWDRLISVLEKVRRPTSTPQVLIVEDDAQTREMLRVAVQKQGWQGIEAENGRIALERLSNQIPGVILLDLMMPEMDGFTFMAELRRRPEYRDIPVIVVTAKELTGEERQRLRGQVHQILEKGGYSTRELLNEIARLLNNISDLAKNNQITCTTDPAI